MREFVDSKVSVCRDVTFKTGFSLFPSSDDVIKEEVFSSRFDEIETKGD